jgi:hypothetical protein
MPCDLPWWLAAIVKPDYRPFVFNVPLLTEEGAHELWRSLAHGYGFKQMEAVQAATVAEAKQAVAMIRDPYTCEPYGEAMTRLPAWDEEEAEEEEAEEEEWDDEDEDEDDEL